MSKSSVSKSERAEAIKMLRKFLKPGDRVYGIVQSVSRSGMSRRIKFYCHGTYSESVYKDGRDTGRKVRRHEMIFLSGYMAKAMGYSMDRDGGLLVQGCGMDMIFDTVYNLGRTLWPKGDGKTVSGRNGDTGPETDGGYLLKYGQL